MAIRFYMVCLIMFAPTLYAGDEPPLKPATVQKELIFKKGDNWGAEHCFELQAGRSVHYRFSAEVELDFDFHLHPHKSDNSYHSQHFERLKAISAHEGQAASDQSGLCCFHFYPVKPVDADKKILLFYQVKKLPDKP